MRKIRKRRKLSMTSLIDVIFLLLLFFMLTSTFTRFAEVELATGGSGTMSGEQKLRPVFLQLGAEQMSLNGQDVPVEVLAKVLALAAVENGATGENRMPVLVALKGEVTAQRLTDILVELRKVKIITPTVLGAA